MLKRRVEVELWAFRSRELPHATGPEDAGHPDGTLGFLVLHKDVGDDGEKEQEAAVGAPVPDDVRDGGDSCRDQRRGACS
ncbi:hypothetical protein E2562_032437 [Oryza meyeriana var. granulata]|uniref:Uncharacterized protein n=1 Tax=Oryza meyeriana var. granulata TaxID=110450 RepID=A0A6G1E5C4_9ORYZ|nr:hypothetical protein E2562_032437 [Oryza meyeriana var. granulata]